MSKSAKLVFFGTEHFSLPSLNSLIEAGWDVAAVVTKPDSARGRGRLIGPPAVKTAAKAAGIKVWQPDKLTDLKELLQPLGARTGVLVAYGKIIPQSVLDLFDGGIINLHPSLLPRHRGPSPIESAILSGDNYTGVSLMRLSAKMDAGPVYSQQSYRLSGDEDRLGLSVKLANLGAELLVAKLPAIIEGSLDAMAQDETQATYTRLLTKADGLIDWSKPALDIEREIRAFLGFPRSRGLLFGHEVVITKARLAKNAQDGALVIKCGHGYLEVLRLISPSGRLIDGSAFLNGYKPEG